MGDVPHAWPVMPAFLPYEVSIMDVVHPRSKARKGSRSASKRRHDAAIAAPARKTTQKRSLPTARSGSREKRAKIPLGGIAVTRVDRKHSARIRGRLRNYLQSEVTEMERARSVVDCLAVVMQDATHEARGPYYPDVAHADSQMMTRTITNLYELLLDDRLPNVERSDGSH